MGSPPCSPRARKNPVPVSRIERPYLSLYRRSYPMSEYAVSFQNQPVDVSEEFSKQESHLFLGSRVDEFDQRSATGKIVWKSMALKQRVSYHQVTLPLEDYRVWRDVPPEEYQDDRDLPFSISFITPRTVRLRLAARPETTLLRKVLSHTVAFLLNHLLGNQPLQLSKLLVR